jgi:carboxypeptidase Taq
MGLPFDLLLAALREAALLESSAAILAWDQETMMPPGAVAHRADQLEQIAQLAHSLRTAPRVRELLAAAADDPRIAGDPHSPQARSLTEIRRRQERVDRLPADLVGRLAHATSLAQHHWAQARTAGDFAAFAPWLERIVALQREKAACLGASPGGEPWDALAEENEPGLTAAGFAAIFARLQPGLLALRDRIAASRVRPAPIDGRFPIAAQEAFVRFVAAQLGFDFERGRLDRSVHPFCGGSHPGDVRITTRYREQDLLDGLGSTMHEVGHGLYEQGLPEAAFGAPAGEAASLGMHESQSRLWENQVGRSAAFWRWAAPHARRHFPDAAEQLSESRLWHAANLVAPGPIRVDADEVHYDLHVAIRFELERALLRGDLPVAELPAAWNARTADLLGIAIANDRDGCLQDVHWSAGLFGYFPTYTLGNLYASQFWSAARAAIPDLGARIEAGRFAPLLGWLREHVHRHGHVDPAAEICRRATGSAADPAIRLRDLEQRLAPVYGL